MYYKIDGQINALNYSKRITFNYKPDAVVTRVSSVRVKYFPVWFGQWRIREASTLFLHSTCSPAAFDSSTGAI